MMLRNENAKRMKKMEVDGKMIKRMTALCMALLCLTLHASAALRPQGSVNLLDGRTVLITVYLSDEGAEWTRPGVTYVHKAMKIATDYLARQAAACGAQAELIWDEEALTCDIYYEGMIDDSLLEDSTFYDTALSLIEKELSIDAILRAYDTDSYGFVLILPCWGGAYALPYDGEYEEDYQEACVISLYDEENDGEYQSVPVFAHELLHLFGAIDLYEENEMDGVTEALVEYIEENEPTELMYYTYELDDTASTTGITQTLSDVTLYSLGLISYTPILDDFPLLKREDVAAFYDKTALYEASEE